MARQVPAMRSRAEVEAELRGFLAGRSKLVDIADVAGEEELFASGILDSLAFAEVVTFVEEKLGVRSDGAEEVTMESFGTIDRIVGRVVAGDSERTPPRTPSLAGAVTHADPKRPDVGRFMAWEDLTITPLVSAGTLAVAVIVVVLVRRLIPLGLIESLVVVWFVQEWVALGVLWVLRTVWPFRPGVYTLDHPMRFRWNLYSFISVFNLYVSTYIMPPPLLRKLLYRLMGARFEPGIVSISGHVAEPHLLEVGRGAMIGNGALVLSHALTRQEGRDLLVLGRIRIGRSVMIGARCIIMPDVVIGDGATVNVGSLVAMGSRIGPDEVWGGSPAVRLAGPPVVASAGREVDDEAVRGRSRTSADLG